MARHAPPPRLAWLIGPLSVAVCVLAVAAVIAAAVSTAPRVTAAAPEVPTVRPVDDVGARGGQRFERAVPTPPAVVPTDVPVSQPDDPVIVDQLPVASPSPAATSEAEAGPAAPQRSTASPVDEPQPSAAPLSVAAAAPPVDTPDPEPEPEPAPAAPDLVGLVNRDRAAHGCPPVTAHPDLMGHAQAHAERQAADDDMHHSDGPSGFDSWAENVAAGYGTAEQVHEAWMSSRGHRENILNCDYTLMGFGSAGGPSGRYWTQVFGS